MPNAQPMTGRRQFLKTLGSTAVGLGAASHVTQLAEAGEEKADRRPNIIVFFSDQQRWDTVGAYGRPIAPITPNLDRMAAEGTRFESAFTCQPVCGPARSCIQTGRYATETGCFRNGIALPVEEPTIARHLANAGYEVGYIGKWHLASTHGRGTEDINYRTLPIPPERRGGYKDYWLASDILEFTSHGYDGHMFNGAMQRVEFPEGRYRADCLTDFALEYLRQRKQTRPLLLFISYIEPHHQNDHGHFEGPHGSPERFKDYRAPGDLVGMKGDWQREMPDYLGCCASLDENLGRLRAEVRRLGLDENTVMLYTADHGCHFRTRNGEYKRSCHEASIRVPMIASGPGFQGGGVVKQLASLIDVAPTILTAGGLAPPDSMRGRPLQTLVDGTARDWPEEAFVQISESQVGRAVRTARWKYSVRAPGKNGGRDAASDVYVEDFLYDLDNDPHERTNLVSDAGYAATRKELAGVLLRRMKAAGEKEPRIEPA